MGLVFSHFFFFQVEIEVEDEEIQDLESQMHSFKIVDPESGPCQMQEGESDSTPTEEDFVSAAQAPSPVHVSIVEAIE